MPIDLSGAVTVAAKHGGRNGYDEGGILVRYIRRAEAVRVLFTDHIGAHVPFHEARVHHQCREEIEVARNATNNEAIKRRAHVRHRLVTVGSIGDEFGDHRVVIHGNFTALEHASVHTHMVIFRRWAVVHEATSRWQEVTEWILGIDAGFNGPAVDAHVSLGNWQFIAIGHTDHEFHQVDTGYQFSHRVFHLETGVHLQEIEVALVVDNELHGAGRLVVHRLRQGDRLLAHLLARCLVKKRRRCFFNHFLVTALQGTFTFIEIDHVAMAVGNDLDLDMAWFLDEFLREDAIVAEAGARFVRGALEAVPALFVVASRAHALAATARGCLEHHRVADLICDFNGMIPIT